MSEHKQPPQHQGSQPGDEHDMHPEPEFIRPSYRGADKLKDKVAIITGGAVQALVRSLTMSLIGRGIRVNAVAPGPVWTPLIPAS